MEKNNKLRLIYILPNLFTAASAFVGVISLINAAHGNFLKSFYLIFLALFFDGLDGRVARLTNTTSKFGAEFDSLSDIISFGIAPAMLFFFAIGENFHKLGSLVAAVYVVFGAVRLARFNVTSVSTEPSVFIGVPIPTAAIFTSSWVMTALSLNNPIFDLIVLINVILISFLMVSNIRYPSFKKIDIQKAYMRKILILLILAFSLLYLNPVLFMLFGSTFYVFYGIIRSFYHLVLRKRGKS